MKILLVKGRHNSGKTWFSRRLKELLPDQVHIVESYTSRKEREDDKKYGGDHIFTSKDYMESIMEETPEEIVASTMKDGEYYMALQGQFDEDKLNVYTVDEWGRIQAKVWANTHGYLCKSITFGKLPIPPFTELDSELQDKLCKDVLADYGLMDGDLLNTELGIGLLKAWMK